MNPYNFTCAIAKLTLTKVRQHDHWKDKIHREMGDGRLCFVWLDPWVPGGSIIEQYGKRVIYNAESRQDARLPKFLMNEGEWRWPIVSWELLELREMIQGVGPCMSIGGSLGLGSRQLG